MNENIELEYKVLVSDEQFSRLMEAYPPEETVIQINHYFDDSEFSNLNRHRVIRIREFPDSYEFTMKYYDESHDLHEISKPMSDRNLSADPELCSFLNDCSVNPDSLKEFACLRTERRIHRDGYGELCFDRNTYADTEDLEIEYEMIYPCDDFYERFLEIIKKADIEYQPSKPKIMRCYLHSVAQKHN